MIQIHVDQRLRLTAGIVACWLGLATLSWSAENQPPMQPIPSQPAPSSASSPTGHLLTIEDAVRIGLENHPRIRSANERIGSQNAILGQQMSAYYPTVSMANSYRTSQSSTNGGNDHAADTFSS